MAKHRKLGSILAVEKEERERKLKRAAWVALGVIVFGGALFRPAADLVDGNMLMAVLAVIAAAVFICRLNRLP